MKLQINSITKTYNRNFEALKDFNLTLDSGILGLLGPNGAGKSTLMKIITTILKPSSGTVHLNGEDIQKNPDAIRNVLGYLPQNFGVYPNLTAQEYLSYLAALKGLDAKSSKARIDELLNLVNLPDVGNKRLSEFSGGMKQRVGIAQALLNDPQIIIVDEPTVGLDPEERARFAHLITEISENKIIILSTHIVSDIEATATKIAIIKNGINIVHDTSENILKEVQGKVYKIIIPSSEFQSIKSKYKITKSQRRPDGIHITILTDDPPIDARSLEPSLEEAYLYFVNKS